MYDLIIIGGGPAGLTAAAYAIRRRLETLLISEDLGGKANYRMQLPHMQKLEVITGEEVVNKFKGQLRYLDYARRIDRVIGVTPKGQNYLVHTDSGATFEGRALIVATGVMPRTLGVPGEARLLGRGVSYSAISHAHVFVDKDVAVVGSGRLALRAAAELSGVARQVYLIAPDDGELDSNLGRFVQRAGNVDVWHRWGVAVIWGHEYVESIVVETAGGEERELPAEAVFIELGVEPQSALVAHLVDVNQAGRIVVDNRGRTSRSGIFAAGDVTDSFTEQVLIAIGDGAKAALSAFEYLLERGARMDWTQAARQMISEVR